jgi:hypothetical protein
LIEYTIEAQRKLNEMLAAVDKGLFVEPHKITVAEHVRARVKLWEDVGDISARSAQRYRQLVEHQIVPHIGAKPLQKLGPSDVEVWHAALRTDGKVRGEGGLSGRTIRDAHKVLARHLTMPPAMGWLTATSRDWKGRQR